MARERTGRSQGGRTGNRHAKTAKAGPQDAGNARCFRRGVSPVSPKRSDSRHAGEHPREWSRMSAVHHEADDTPVLVGRRPVLEAFRAGRAMTRLWVQEGIKEGSIREIVGLAHSQHLPLSEVPKPFLDRLAGDVPHQGVAAQVALKPVLSLDELPALIAASAQPLLYVLDGIQDPHNLGAILRTADAVGATAVVIPDRGAVGLTAVVAKASAGAIEYMPVVRVINLAQAIDKIKEQGVFVYAADADAPSLYSEMDWTGPIALVIGAEGRGVRPLVKERSDGLARLPMLGHVSSLNAANAAAVLGYEAIRQRGLKNSVLTPI